MLVSTADVLKAMQTTVLQMAQTKAQMMDRTTMVHPTIATIQTEGTKINF